MQNQIGDGGPKIPEGTFVIVKMFTPTSNSQSVSEQFTVPQSGKYRVTVIGKGGRGGDGKERYQGTSGGAGGGSGGWASSLLDLTENDTYQITVNSSVSSFGSLLTASSGTDAEDTTPGTGGTSSGGNLYNNKGLSGKTASSIRIGGNGAAVRNPNQSLFLTSAVGQGGDYDYSWTGEKCQGEAAVSQGPFAPFGAGGGGGGGHHEDLESAPSYAGGDGSKGAVIIELLLEGVNT